MSIYLTTFGKLRYLGLAEMADEPRTATRWALLRTVRGLEMGLLGGALSQEQEARYRASCLEDASGERPRGPEPMLQEVEFLQYAGRDEIEDWYQCRSDEENVLIRSREILLDHGLDMKLVDVEYMLDRRKLFFYFTSDHRVDFRAYVRELAREFRTRIEMRQIGVRDEARVVRGVAPCGRPCCCSYWLHQFSPIGIRMVKEQHLALTPTKISGICGRLMCCMAYEYSVYADLWKDLPAPGTKIRTEQGLYVLDGVDLATGRAKVRFPSGRIVSIAIPEFPDFREAVLRGEDWGAEEAAPPRPAPRPEAARKPAPPQRGTPMKVTLEEHLAWREQQQDEASEAERTASRKGRRRSGAQGRPEAGRPPKPGRPASPSRLESGNMGAGGERRPPRHQPDNRSRRPHGGRPDRRSDGRSGRPGKEGS